RAAGHVPDEIDLVRADPDAAGLEALEVVELAGGVDPGPDLPERAVGLERGLVDGRAVGQRSDQANSTSGARSAARQKVTIRPARSRSQGFSSRGSSPISSSTSSIQRPAMAPRWPSEIIATDVIQDGSTRSIVRSSWSGASS